MIRSLNWEAKTVLLRHGRWKGGTGGQGPRGSWNLTVSYYVFSKKGYLLVSRGKNEISPFLTLSWKNLFGYIWKNPLLAPLEKILPTPLCWANAITMHFLNALPFSLIFSMHILNQINHILGLQIKLLLKV